ncbi:MAG: response regulator [Chloroflexota bacterium]
MTVAPAPVEVEFDTTGKMILVIEDSADLRTDVIDMLKLEGYVAHGAPNGVIGVERAQELMPDLIVCDIMMPELDGYGVLQALRADLETASIPFIFLTAKSEHLDQRQGMVLGANDYFTKPFDAEELLASITTQLKRREEQLAQVQNRIDMLAISIATALPHELRTPLNTIIGFSELLQTEAQTLKPDQVASWSNHIYKAGYRLYRLVENYLYYVRLQVAIDKGTTKEIEDPLMDLRTTIELQALNHAQQYKRPDDLVMDVEDTPKFVLEDKDANKLVEELVDNAFKFSVAKTPVTVTGKLQGGDYVLTVSDKGRGMTREQISKIGGFMQFERWLHEQQGMGLGLVVVKLLAEINNYEFIIQSAKDEGTSVTLIFKQN